MHVVWVVIGAVVGLVLGSQIEFGVALFGMILGGFGGYTLAELASLRARNHDLQKEIDLLKERLNALWRRQKESEQAVQELAPASPKKEAPGAFEVGRDDPKEFERIQPARPAMDAQGFERYFLCGLGCE